MTKEWYGAGALHLARPGERFAIVGVWTQPEQLDCWYINLQDPLRRTRIGFDTMDLILDIVVSPDLSEWRWKDEAQFADAAVRGVFTAVDAARIRAAGLAGLEQLRANHSLDYRQWAAWKPPPDWQPADLPDGWDNPERD